MFALKLLLSPLLIGLVSLAGRRWGPSVSGWLVGLPLTSGPVVFLLALGQGTVFATHAVQGTLWGLISVVSFCLAYSWCSFRLNWLGSLLAGWGIFFLSTALLLHVSAPLPVTFACVIAVSLLALVLQPRRRKQSHLVVTPRWDTPVRMIMAASFVVLITEISSAIGPQLSGLLTPFPMFASILGAFTHRFQGAEAARQSLSGVMIGSFSSSVFLLIVAATLERAGIAIAFSLALLGILLTQCCSLWLMQKRAGKKQLPIHSNEIGSSHNSNRHIPDETLPAQ